MLQNVKKDVLEKMKTAVEDMRYHYKEGFYDNESYADGYEVGISRVTAIVNENAEALALQNDQTVFAFGMEYARIIDKYRKTMEEEYELGEYDEYDYYDGYYQAMYDLCNYLDIDKGLFNEMTNAQYRYDMSTIAKFALDQKFFEITDCDNDYGCVGVHCRVNYTSGATGFYFDSTAAIYDGIESYRKDNNENVICDQIADTLNSMAREIENADEVKGYLEDILYGFSKTPGIEKIESILLDTIRIANETLEKEMER